MLVGRHHDTTFDLAKVDYQEFYAHHQFMPMGEDIAFDINEIIPRFGWAFDCIEELSKDKPVRVLDIGCLDGSFLLTVASHQPNVSGLGVDLTEDGIVIAKERAKARNLPLTFRQGLGETIMYELAANGEKFDVVTAFEILEHVEDPELFLSLIDEVLAPGGTVLLSTPAFESPIYGKNDVGNKCHIRLYTTKDEDYEEMTDLPDPETGKPYMRTATSLSKQVGKKRIVEMEVLSELINCRYK